MSATQYGDFETFLLDSDERLFRFSVYRRVFTPFEWDKRFTDQGEFDQVAAHFGFIRESIPLPDGDVLLGIKEIYPDEMLSEEQNLDYYRLSEIRLAYYPGDSARIFDEE